MRGLGDTHANNKRAAAFSANRFFNLILGPSIAGFTLLCLLLGLEIVGFYWETKTAQGPLGWTLVASRRLELEQAGTADRPYYLARPEREYRWGEIPVRINSQGFRSAEFTVPKSDSRTRILNLGDSIVFGWNVRFEESHGYQLEQMLQSRHGSDLEVINAGIPGWSPITERNFLLDSGLSFQPDLVLLNLTVVNDIRLNDRVADKAEGIFSWLRDGTYAWPFLTTQFRFLLARQRGPEAIPVLNPPRRAEAYFPIEAESPDWGRLLEVLSEIEAACRVRQIPILLVLFPTAFQLNAEAHPDLPQRILAEFAAVRQIDLVDLLPIYSEACHRKGPEACEGFDNLIFADVWMHPNALGHRLAAEAILPFLESRLWTRN